MNKEEIREALRIIKEPITVNTTTYHYFDQENYDKLQRVYDNCRWFINNEEQLIQNIEHQQQELKRYKNIIDELIEYGDNCLENLKDQDNYMCESIDVVGLMQMIHIMYLEKLKELKGE